jgi:general secretion pathway protein D
MVLKRFFILSIVLGISTSPLVVMAEAQLATDGTAPLRSARPKKRKKLISFNFDNEDLVTIVNYLATEKKINIILPPPPNTLTNKVTLRYQKKLSIDDAFTMLNTLLDMSGYIMRPHGNTYIISKASNVVRETLPIYIGVAPEDLPNSDESIRYLYYFDNIKIPKDASGQAQDIKSILEDMLQDPTKPGSSQIIFDGTTNCVIITAKAYNIKTAMQIIEELDKTGFREVVEIVPITNSTADFVGKFLTEQLLALAPDSPLAPPNGDTSYFSKTTKVIPDPRSNSLIILGRAEAVNKLKNFIYDYIDVPVESGDSLIHVYELQYLDAQTFAENLRAIIKPAEIAGQAKGSTTENQSFKGVIIETEKPAELGKLQTQAGDVGVAVQGGNRLIIAAKKSDWKALKQLIESLDKPQPQIALEILVADISLSDAKAFGSQIRNKENSLPMKANAQFAGLAAPVVGPPPNQTLQQNLLLPVADPSGNLFNLANSAPTANGSFILSFNDPDRNGIWWVMDLLKNFQSTKILSHPHIITLNQVQAKVAVAVNRLADGPVNRNPDGSISRLKVNLDASLSVEILPRINLSNSINLQIAVKVNNFVDNFSDARNTRTVITNATVGNGEVLVLGGLVKTSEADNLYETPVLAKIPLIGWFFKSHYKTVSKDNLMVFIAPTVVKPKIGGGMSETSSSKFARGRGYVEESKNFESIRDPITRWFFKSPKNSTKDMVHDYEEGRMFGPTPLKGGESEAELEAAQAKSILANKKARKKNQARPTKRIPQEEQEQTEQLANNDADDVSETQKLKDRLANESNPLKNNAAA